MHSSIRAHSFRYFFRQRSKPPGKIFLRSARIAPVMDPAKLLFLTGIRNKAGAGPLELFWQSLDRTDFRLRPFYGFLTLIEVSNFFSLIFGLCGFLMVETMTRKKAGDKGDKSDGC